MTIKGERERERERDRERDSWKNTLNYIWTHTLMVGDPRAAFKINRLLTSPSQVGVTPDVV